MTERLYYHDSYQREFRAEVKELAEEGRRVYLDRTAFYPTSGGQPFDLGTIGGVAVREVVDEDQRVAHLLEGPLVEGPLEPAAGEVACSIDWPRRYDHMQQHTGQHLLSAVLADLFGMATVGFHMGAETSTIDLNAPAVAPEQIERVEERCAQLVGEARPVAITFEDAAADLDLRKASQRSGTLRIVSIQGIDRSACGGTHLRSTAEIGPLLVRKLEKVRGAMRLEFVCGGRALNRARADYRLLTGIARSLGARIDRTDELVLEVVERAKSLEKSAQKLAVELARREGRELYLSTEPGADGLRRRTERGAMDEAMRARAQAFCLGEKAVFLGVCEQPPAIVLAVSADSGIDAEETVKTAVSASGGRGGGSRTIAQGSAPVLRILIESLNIRPLR